MVMDYARHTHVQMILVHLDSKKACDNVELFLVFRVNDAMGFGPYIRSIMSQEILNVVA